MNSTSLTPISLSVPPVTGVPGLTAPPVAAPDAAAVEPDVEPPVPLLEAELLHAAASRVTATAAAAPTACSLRCFTTLILLIALLGEDRSPRGIPGVNKPPAVTLRVQCTTGFPMAGTPTRGKPLQA